MAQKLHQPVLFFTGMMKGDEQGKGDLQHAGKHTAGACLQKHAAGISPRRYLRLRRLSRAPRRQLTTFAAAEILGWFHRFFSDRDLQVGRSFDLPTYPHVKRRSTIGRTRWLGNHPSKRCIICMCCTSGTLIHAPHIIHASVHMRHTYICSQQKKRLLL